MKDKVEEVTLRISAGAISIKDARCPVKGCDLMDPKVKFSGLPAIGLNARHGGRTGSIHLNPYYGIFEFKTELKIATGEVIDLFCPECGASLKNTESICSLCNIPMFSMVLGKGGYLEACPTVGCHKHKLILVEMDDLFLKLYEEETRPRM